MSETLLIHYNIDNAQQATWSVCNNDGELTGKITTGTLSELSEITADYTAIVLLNSQCLHINQLQLPTQNVQKILKAVPYAIEDFIADDVDEFHFVVARNKHNNYTSVVGINKTTLENIIQTFQSAGINPEKILPDTLCLAANQKQWVCLNHNNTDYLQTDITDGMLISDELLPYVVSNKLQDENQTKPDKILLFCEQENTGAHQHLKSESFTDEDDIEIVNISYNTHPLVVFCGNYKQALPLNLLQQKFKPKRKSSGYLQHWRLAASLTAIWLSLSLGLTAFQHAQLENENTIIRAKIENIYKKSFPKSKKIVNPRVQMEQKLKALKNSANGNNQGLVYLLAESFGTLSNNKANITFQSLNYRNNRMDIGLESSNLQAVENLNNNLNNNNNNIKSEITSSSSEKNKVKGNLRIEARS